MKGIQLCFIFKVSSNMNLLIKARAHTYTHTTCTYMHVCVSGVQHHLLKGSTGQSGLAGEMRAGAER